jgi:hypothetical protein
MQKELILSETAKEARRQLAAKNREKRKQGSETKSLDLVSMNIS